MALLLEKKSRRIFSGTIATFIEQAWRGVIHGVDRTQERQMVRLLTESGEGGSRNARGLLLT